jgi:hypothetical protein
VWKLKEDMCERGLQVKLDKRQINWLEVSKLLVWYGGGVLCVYCLRLLEIDWSRWRKAKIN